MVATNSLTSTTATGDADYEAYQTVVQLVSAGVSKGITDSLGKLKDPNTFSALVRDLASIHGIAAATLTDPMALYNGFWTLANGLDTDFRWRSNAGIPARSTLIVDAVKPLQQPVSLANGGAHPGFSIGVSAFGVSLGASW